MQQVRLISNVETLCTFDNDEDLLSLFKNIILYYYELIEFLFYRNNPINIIIKQFVIPQDLSMIIIKFQSVTLMFS